MCHIFFIHPFVDGYLHWFNFLVIMNTAAKNMVMQLSVVGYMPRDGIAGSYGCCVLNILRSLHTNFHMVLLICTPTSSEQWFLFPHITANVCCQISL